MHICSIICFQASATEMANDKGIIIIIIIIIIMTQSIIRKILLAERGQRRE